MDSGFLTPWLEVETVLDTLYIFNSINYLWYNELDNALKLQIDYIRFVLSKIIYSFKLPINGVEGVKTGGSRAPNTVVDSKNVSVTTTADFDVSISIPAFIALMQGYIVYYSDSTQANFVLDTANITYDTNYFYIYIKHNETVDKTIIGIDITNSTWTTHYVNTTFPNTFLDKDSNLIFDISIQRV
jgi:hypothetical protein